ISRYHANYASTGTTAVMAYPANSQGLHDMIGNVWEWTDSWYLSYPGNPKPSPHFGEKYRVVRGGAWMYDGSHCQSAYRNANQPERCYPTVGFRTVRDLG
ncbi:MAG: SUMF1/EgtB/PvdO family nonheme iron enzyme, partial [Chlamydiia bacterium]|nr:SUMF1/EgtB/PvdO family nonheme iron enzyme [Chlamydiia bacterium]